MPQMAPVMWLPLFLLIISLVLVMKCNIYFAPSSCTMKTNLVPISFTANWLW